MTSPEEEDVNLNSLTVLGLNSEIPAEWGRYMAVRLFEFRGGFEFELDLVGFPLSRCHVTVLFDVEFHLDDFRVGSGRVGPALMIAPALMTKTGGWARARSRSRRGAGPFSAASEEGGVSIRDEGQPTPHESVGCSR